MFARTLSAAALCVLLVSPTSAATSPDPYAEPDNAWISLSGVIHNPTPDSFLLDYADGAVIVEMDDWDNLGDAYGLKSGDRVTVYGEVDDSLYETTTIEAASVYVQDLNTFFYANSADEEGDGPAYLDLPAPEVVTAATSIRGTVVDVDRDARTFTIDTGPQKLTVLTSDLSYDPFDDTGFQKIEPHDVVSVSGRMDAKFFTERKLEARSILTVIDASGS